MRTHTLKVDPLPFDLTVQGLKKCEFRKDDRGYEEGDSLHMLRTTHTGAQIAAGAPLAYTGEFATCTITHLLRGPAYGVPDGYVVMSVRVDIHGVAS